MGHSSKAHNEGENGALHDNNETLDMGEPEQVGESESELDFTTMPDSGEEEVYYSEDGHFDLVLERLTDLANLSRGNQEPALGRISTRHLIEIDPWTPNELIRSFYRAGFMVNAKTVRAIVKNPYVIIDTIPVLADIRPAGSAVSSSAQRGLRMPAARRKPQLALGTPNASYGLNTGKENPPPFFRKGRPSDHPTGQVPREGEIFELDEATGEWFVRFQWRLFSNLVYEQLDPLPTFNPDAPEIPNLQEGRDTYMSADQDDRIHNFGHRRDPGRWVPKEDDAENGGLYIRHYVRKYDPDTPQYKFNYAGVATQLHFIVRKFDVRTNQYLWRYKWGKTWDDFEENLSSFDINDKKSRTLYDNWFKQLVGKFDFRYEKQHNRQCWEKYELKALRQFFINFLQKFGLMESHRNIDWKLAVDKINALRRHRDPQCTIRNINGVSSQAERQFYGRGVDRLGINEWRQAGAQLKDLLDRNPGHKQYVTDDILKPRNCIDLDDIKAKKPGGPTNQDKKRARKENRVSLNVRGMVHDKILFHAGDKMITVSDRFGNNLLRRYFPDIPEAWVQRTVKNQKDAIHEQKLALKGHKDEEDIGDDDGDTDGPGQLENEEIDVDSEDDTGTPQPKRARY